MGHEKGGTAMRIPRRVSKVFWFFVLFFIFVAPLLLMSARSVSFRWSWPDIYPETISFRAWEVIFRDPDIIWAIAVTIFIATVVVILNFMLAVPAAYGLSRYRFRGKPFIEAVLMLPILVPVLAIAMGMHLTMIRLGLADSAVGVILIHLMPTIPYAVRVMKAGFDRLSPDWEEQCSTLGVNRWRLFWTMLVPQIIPSIRSMAVLVFVISLSQYVLTLIIGGGRIMTLPMIYYPYFTSGDGAVVAGFSVLFALLPIVFLIVFEGLLRLYMTILQRP